MNSNMISQIRVSVSAAATVLILLLASFPNTSKAQSYSIDCAILICLSGGWPASAPCARARSEFIRRITPWPIEPPLQIWRCPMGASHSAPNSTSDTVRFFNVLFKGPDHLQSQPMITDANLSLNQTFVLEARNPVGQDFTDAVPQYVGETADIDISGPEFNFVRSIRVFDVFIDDDRDDGECSRYARVRVGRYGTQGDFRWSHANRGDIPTAFGRTVSGCSLYARAVFVEWRDYLGTYGFERVDY